MSKPSTEQHGVTTSCPYSWLIPAWQRLLEQHRSRQLAHAYLVCGEQGIGKFKLIESFARFLLCSNPEGDQLCGKCVNCELSAGGNHPDILIVEPEDGSRDIKIDQIRAVTQYANRTSHSGIMKLILINQAHHLNSSAANSLLKTLEEPSSDTFLFLVSERPGSLPATLRSRCQRLPLPTPTTMETIAWLQEHGTVPAQAVSLATAASNRPLYALELANQDGIATTHEFMQNLTRLLQRKQTLQAVVAIALKLDKTAAAEYLLTISSIVIRSLLTAQDAEDEQLQELVAQLRLAQVDQAILHRRFLDFYTEVELALRQLRSGTNPNPQLVYESLLWQFSRLDAKLENSSTM